MRVNELREKINNFINRIDDEELETKASELLKEFENIDGEHSLLNNEYEKYTDFLCNNVLVQCDFCGDIDFESDTERTCDGEIICERCFDNDWCHCERCGHVVRCDETYAIDDGNEYWCENCRENWASYCDHCDCYVSDNVVQVYTTADRSHYEYWCETCCDNGDVQYCDECNETFTYDCGQYDEDNDAWYCYECCGETQLATIHNYSYKPFPEFKTTQAEQGIDHNNLCFFGVETEIDSSSRVDKKAVVNSVAEILKDFFYYKSDGSLNYGFECVSHPATINYWLENKDTIKRAFETLIEKDMRSHQTSTCGYHIHASRTYLGNTLKEQENTINKIILILEGFRPQVERFSRRKEYRWSQFMAERAKSDNVIVDTEDIKNTKVIDKAKRQMTSRYSVLNLNNGATIELRVLRGTLNIETFIAGLQFFQNVIDIAKRKTEKQLNGLKWGKIINYNKDFVELKSYNKRRGIDNDAVLVVNNKPKTLVIGDRVQIVGNFDFDTKNNVFASLKCIGKITDTHYNKYVVEIPKKEIARVLKQTNARIDVADNGKYYLVSYADNLKRVKKEDREEGEQ